tara:strand:+ start:608 stop:1201 length:594 start_codon:yes stop_codon:yes gene_type:complete
MTIETKKIEASDLLDLSTYSKERRNIRKEVVEMKKNRRVELGPHSTLYFENFLTMKAQVQEMLFIEKGGDEQLKDELEAYNPLIPQGKEIVATLMFEIDNPETRKKVLSSLGKVETKIYLGINDDLIYATPEGDVERTDVDGKTSSVHFLHFYLNDKQIFEFKKKNNEIKFGTDHENYPHSTTISKEVHKSLIDDLD